jgi:hypothetical protein
MPGNCPNLGWDELPQLDFSLFPNPASDDLQIVLNQPANKLSLFTISGDLIREESVLSQHMQIDISDLPNGLYFIVIQGDGGLGALRFSVVR